ncbi:MAG TPA: hypothetical protein VGN00_20260 [Puia sp.]|jgi:hypothetical protein
MRIINPPPFEKVNDLALLFYKFIEERKNQYQLKIDALKLQFPLVSYVAIGDVNGFCSVIIEDKIPDWLRQFIMNCYADATDEVNQTL